MAGWLEKELDGCYKKESTGCYEKEVAGCYKIGGMRVTEREGELAGWECSPGGTACL